MGKGKKVRAWEKKDEGHHDREAGQRERLNLARLERLVAREVENQSDLNENRAM
jgi:hypothetical protein